MALRGNPLFRTVDRVVGIPLVSLLGAVRRHRRLDGGWRRIGLLRSSAIGDTVLLSAVVSDLRRARPDAEVVLFCGSDNAGMARLVDGVDVVQEISLTRPWAAIRTLRSNRLDVLIDFAPWPRIDAILCALAGARCSIGFRTRGQYRHRAYDVAVEHRGDRHELENYRALPMALGISGSARPQLRPRGLVSRTALPGEPFLVFHLFPGGFRSALREWPMENWLELARRMTQRGFRVLLSGAPSDRPAAEAFRAMCAAADVEVSDIAGRYSLAEMLDVVAASDGVVSVNTGMAHIAAAVDAVTVALNGPTNTVRWGPIGVHAQSVESSLPGCGFLNLGFEYDGQRTDCMRGISIDDVEHALLRMLSSDVAGPRAGRAAV